jgi:hypothetical protein
MGTLHVAAAVDSFGTAVATVAANCFPGTVVVVPEVLVVVGNSAAGSCQEGKRTS